MTKAPDDTHAARVVRRSTRLRAGADEVWAEAVTPAGINRELGAALHGRIVEATFRHRHRRLVERWAAAA